MLAFMMDQHDTIGIDAVAMCVNDIVVQGAEPLYFLDYIACGKAEPEKIEAIVKGLQMVVSKQVVHYRWRNSRNAWYV